MYSVILMAGMMAAPVEPQGLLNRGGCSGTPAATVRVKVREVVAAQPVRSTLAAINDRRPHLLGHIAHAVAHRGAGCVGSCGVTATVGAGCTGHAAMPAGPPATVVRVQTVTVAPAAPQTPLAGPLRDRKPIRAFLIHHGVPEGQLVAYEARVGAGNVNWMELLLAFVRGGLESVLKLIGGV